MLNFSFVQSDFKPTENYKHHFAHVCHNLIKLTDPTDISLVAFWQLLQMEISVQKGWQTISGMWNSM